jgi:hypothetical protein
LRLLEVSDVDEEPTWCEPVEFLATLPQVIKVVREIPGVDGHSYWLAELAHSLVLTTGQNISHLVIAPIFNGTSVEAGVVSLDEATRALVPQLFGPRWGDALHRGRCIVLRVGYVLDRSLLSDQELALSKATYVATALAEALTDSDSAD